MSLKTIGRGLLAVGTIITVFAFFYDTAPEGTHNLGLLQWQMMLLHTGLIIALGGGIAAVFGETLYRMEQAGLLPPAGVLPTLGTGSKADGA